MRNRNKSDSRSYLPLQPAAFEILLALNDSEKHGYRIIRDIEERTAGAVRLGTSSLYAAIRRLVAGGLVEDAGRKTKEASGGPPRRYYRLSNRGREVMRLEALRLQDVATAAREQVLEPETWGVTR
jgi:DNA-binding PadR family transcriptional regulator